MSIFYISRKRKEFRYMPLILFKKKTLGLSTKCFCYIIVIFHDIILYVKIYKLTMSCGLSIHENIEDMGVRVNADVDAYVNNKSTEYC